MFLNFRLVDIVFIGSHVTSGTAQVVFSLLILRLNWSELNSASDVPFTLITFPLQKYSVIGRSRASLIPLSLSFYLSDFFRAPLFFLGIFFDTPVLVNSITQQVVEVPRRSHETRKEEGTGRKQ